MKPPRGSYPKLRLPRPPASEDAVTASSLDVLLTVGDAEPRVVSLAAGEPGEVSLTVLFPIDGATVSLTFDAERFLAFVEQLRRFAATMPGRPS